MKFQRNKSLTRTPPERTIKSIKVVDTCSIVDTHNNSNNNNNNNNNNTDTNEQPAIIETSRRNSYYITQSHGNTTNRDGASTRRKSTLREFYASLDKYKEQKQRQQQQKQKQKQMEVQMQRKEHLYENVKNFYNRDQLDGRVHGDGDDIVHQNLQQHYYVEMRVKQNIGSLGNIHKNKYQTVDNLLNRKVSPFKNSNSNSHRNSLKQIMYNYQQNRKSPNFKLSHIPQNNTKQIPQKQEDLQQIQYIINMLKKLTKKQQLQLQELRELRNSSHSHPHASKQDDSSPIQMQIQLAKAQQLNKKLKLELLEMKELMKSLLLEREEQRMFSFYQDQ